MMRGTIARFGVLSATIVLATGCASYKHEYAGYPSDQVWSSMLAAAQTPDYDDKDPARRWTVVDNEVWVDEPAQRIEIYRRLARRLYQPGTKPLDQKREWRFEVSLLEPEEDVPPTAKFVGRGFYIYAHVDAEAKRYFADVGALLEVEETAIAE